MNPHVAKIAKTCTEMINIKIRTVVNSRGGRRDDRTRERSIEDFQCLCNVFFHKNNIQINNGKYWCWLKLDGKYMAIDYSLYSHVCLKYFKFLKDQIFLSY